MFGVNAYLIRMLCEDPFNTGGAGYTPNQVAKMTPDQVWFRLCDKDFLKTKMKKGRTQTVSPGGVAQIVDKDGMVKVRTQDGSVVHIPFSLGKSKVQMIREKMAKEKKEKKRNGS